MKCSYCSGGIDNDSYFCDQCGRELFLCRLCGKPVDGNFCEDDGGETFSPAKENPIKKDKTNDTAGFIDPAKTAVVAGQVKKSDFRLVNETLGLSLAVEDELVLGRTAGKYVAELGRFRTVSGRHVAFSYKAGRGWFFKDLNSTNKTKYSGDNRSWDTLAACVPGEEFELHGGYYLLVADIEFRIDLDDVNGPGGNKTARI